MPFDPPLPELAAVDLPGRRALEIYARYNQLLQDGAVPTMPILCVMTGQTRKEISQGIALLATRFDAKVTLRDDGVRKPALPAALKAPNNDNPLLVQVWEAFHDLIVEGHRPTPRDVANRLGISEATAREAARTMRTRHRLQFGFGHSFRAYANEALTDQMHRLVTLLKAEGHRPTAPELSYILGITARRVGIINAELRARGVDLGLAMEKDRPFKVCEGEAGDEGDNAPAPANDNPPPLLKKRRRRWKRHERPEVSPAERQAELHAIEAYLAAREPTALRPGVARGLSKIPTTDIDF